MYKLSYYLSGGSVRFKSFETFHEAIEFSQKLKPIDSVIEIKYYDNVDNKKPDRN
jgi:hypothetical protein